MRYKSQLFYYNLDFLSDIFMIYRGNICLFVCFFIKAKFSSILFLKLAEMGFLCLTVQYRVQIMSRSVSFLVKV